MKKRYLRILFVILIIICTGIFFGCNNDDDSYYNEEETDDVEEIEEILVHLDQNMEDGTEEPDCYYKKINVIRLPEYEDGYRDGYSYRGWYVDKECTIEFIDSARNVVYDITDIDEITVYAKWLPIYTVTFDLNGSENELEPINYCVGDSLGLYWITPQRTGYTFDSWLPNLSHDLYVGDFTLTAQWKLKDIDYTSNGDGTCSINCSQDIEAEDFSAKYVEMPSEYIYYEDGEEITEIVTKINDYAFYGCTNIETVVLPDTITEIGVGAFSNCSNLSDINLGEDIISINEECFYSCTSLQDIILPDNIESIGNNAFTNSGLISIQIPEKTVNISSQLMENAFYNCTYLAEYIVEENNANYSSIDGVLYNKDATNLLKYPLAKTNIEFSAPETVEEISEMAFESCSYLQKLSLGVNLATIYFNETKENNSFYSMKALTDIIVDSQNSNYFTKDGVLYEDAQVCSKLLYYPCAKTETNVVLDDDVLEIGEWAFADSKIINLTMCKRESYVKFYVNCFENSTLENLYIRNYNTNSIYNYYNIPSSTVIYVYESYNSDAWEVVNYNGR
jgi:hypothetical protein